MRDDWKTEWQPLVEMIGQDLVNGAVVWGADAVEAGAVRRYLEPLEFDCALHYDRDVARAHGYADIVVPYTGSASFALAPLWKPGTTIFNSPSRNAQPAIQSLRPALPPEAPSFTGYFATDIELDFLRPVVVGERLGRRGHKLLDCLLKETKVGRGAFCTFENETITDQGEVVARMRFCIFCYNNHPSAEASV